MTKSLAPSYRAALLDNGVDLISGNVKIATMSATYAYSAAHDFHNDLTNIVATTGNLTGKAVLATGAFDFDDPSLGSPAGGSTITQCYLYLDTGVSSTSPLVYYWNEDAAAAAISLATDGTEKFIFIPATGLFIP